MTEFGVTIFLTDRCIRPDVLAAAAEERGFDTVYFPEHTHIPTSRITPSPGGEPIAEEYKRTLDPFVALAAASSVTGSIRLGTGVALVAQHDPIVLAKTVASLDHLSGGRVVFGVGYGWNAEEMADHGVPFSARRDIVADKVAAMRRLWTEDTAGYEGEWVSFSESWSWPKPVQAGGPPVLLGGGGGPKLVEAIVEYADGWMPIGGGGLAERLPILRQAWEDAGRDPAQLRVVPFGTLPEEGRLRYLAEEVGVDEIVVRLPSAPEAEVLAALDEAAATVARVSNR